MKINKYVYNIKGSINKTLVVLSDIHYYDKRNNKLLDRLISYLDNISFDYICIPGDLIDERDIYDEDYLIQFLKSISKHPIFISLGNHEFVKGKDYNTYNKKTFNKINRIKNVYVLDNEIKTIDGINFIGLTLPGEYYYKYKERRGKYLVDYINKQFSFVDKGYNILLCHTPIQITKPDIFNQLTISKYLNLVICGHTHGGITPKPLRKILNGRGLISPHLALFTKNSYGLCKINKTYFIVSSGITKSSHANHFSYLNFLCSPEMTFINISKEGSNYE